LEKKTMITAAFLRDSSLQYRVKTLEKELESFKTGEKYIKMKEEHRKETGALRREIERLKRELEQAHKETRDVRDKWFATCDDIITEEDRNARKALEQILRLKQKCFDIDMKRHDEKAALVDAYEEKLAEKDKVIGELKNRLAHAEALLGRDGTNTGIPTAQTPVGTKKVIPNSRRSTGRKKGGQPGHRQHVLEPPAEEQVDDTVHHEIDPAAEVCPACGGDAFLYTGKTEVKYETDIEIKVHRTKHVYYIYKCAGCGTLVSLAADPELMGKCHYGPNIQAIAVSLMDTTNAAINKVPLFLSAVTGGQVRPSEGYIAKLPKRASKRLASFKKDLRLLILKRRVLYWDDTVISILAEQACLRFYGDEKISYYTAHERKDFPGILEDGILDRLTEETYVMHDHNTVNYNAAFHFRNLECCQHVERDLQKSADETGHEEMAMVKELISEAIKDRNDLAARGIMSFSADRIAAFDARMEELLCAAEARIRAHFNPYNSQNEQNVINRLRAYHDNFFAWMKDFSLPHTNNLSERELRGAKTKKKVSGQFESTQYAGYYADILTYTRTCRKNGINEIYALSRLMQGNPVTVMEIFPEHL
jgi:transposase